MADLNIDSKVLGDDALAQIGTIKGLQSLDFQLAQITGAGFDHFSGLSELRSIQMSNAEALVDAHLAQLAKCPKLRTVEVFSATQLTDAGLAHLAKIESLERIAISNASRITDAGLAQFKSHPKLRSLSLAKCQITVEGIAALKQSLPKCIISR